jgi:hypothetical protein
MISCIRPVVTATSDITGACGPQDPDKRSAIQSSDRTETPAVKPTADAYFALLERLIGESTFNARVYLSCTCALLVFAVGGIVISIVRPPSEAYAKIFASVCGIFSPIPVPLFLATRYQKIYRTFLKTRWLEAQAQKDDEEIKKVKDEVKRLAYKMQWSISWKGSGKSDDES